MAVDNSDELSEILGFDDPELLRATTVSKVLRRGGRLLANSKGSADTWSLSSPVERIDIFISHNWSVGRWRKFVALAVHFNLTLGLATAFVFIVVGLILTEVYGVGRRAIHYATTPAMIAVVLWGRDILDCVGFSGPRVFIDKCCIHQVDEKRKARGIKKLGAFMQRSNSVLACYTDTYLRKLWTVYEICTFLTLNDARNLHVLPVSLPAVALCFSVLYWISSCIFVTMPGTGKTDSRAPHLTEVLLSWAFLGSVSFAALLPTILLYRHLMVQNARLDDAVRTFDLRTAACFCEDDRTLVESNATELARHLKIERSEVHHDALLDEFNARVRSEVPRAIRQSRGRYGMPCRVALLGAIPVITASLEVMRLRVPPGYWILELGYVLENLASFWLTIPVMCLTSKGCVDTRGAWLVARVMLATAGTALVGIVAVGAVESIAIAAMGVAETSAAFQAYVWVKLFFTSLLVAWLYRPEHRASTCIPELTQDRAYDRLFL